MSFNISLFPSICYLFQYDEASREILDIQSEFEFERIDYLDTIRKQERQLLLMQDLIDRISPCIRKDCNYSNIDRIKMDCKWDEEQGKWILPKLTIERTALPVSGKIQAVSPAKANI